MRVLTAPPQGVVVCAVNFDDEETSTLVTSAMSLAERFEMEIRFVHVLDDLATDPWVLDMPANYVALPLYRETQSRLLDERRMQLNQLLNSIKSPVRLCGDVIAGDTTDALIAYSKLHRANLIVTIASTNSYRFLPSGFSTSMTLMAEAPLPVLVLSRERPLDFNTENFRLMLSDDLEASTHEAALRAFEFAARLRGVTVRHVHVHGDFREIIRDSWLDWTSRYPALTHGAEAPDALLQAEYKERLERLAAQGMPYRDRALAAGVEVETDVRLGRVAEQIDQAIDEFDPDLIVFGRHKFLRRRPFLMGRMSSRAMLGEKRSILLVPPSAALYANLPFPAASRAVPPSAPSSAATKSYGTSPLARSDGSGASYSAR